MIENAGGVIGGVGPLATVYFMNRVIDFTEATTDQEHCNLIVLQHSTIPDRTAFLVGTGDDDPLPVMIDDARNLERAGARFIVMPCNTAHHFLSEVAASVQIPFISIVTEAMAAAEAKSPGLTHLGVLATDGTLLTETYKKACDERGITCVTPDADVQAEVMDVIYAGVKAGVPVPRERFDALTQHLRDKGAQVIILGCTELSVLGQDLGLDADVVDSLDALARRTVEMCGKPVRAQA